MAGRKRKAPPSQAHDTATSSRETRSSARRDDIPDIYRHMLADAQIQPASEAPERPLKKRQANQRSQIAESARKGTAPQGHSKDNSDGSDEEDLQFEDVGLPAPNVQTLYRDSDEEEDENLEFEDVDLPFHDPSAETVDDKPRHLELDLSARANTTPRRPADRRKAISRAEKDRRIGIHKMHLLFLLAHAFQRNQWCSDAQVQDRLRPLLTQKMVTYLNPGTHLSQFGRTESLKNGLRQAGYMFKTKFEITERGLRRALWAEKEEDLQNVCTEAATIRVSIH